MPPFGTPLHYPSFLCALLLCLTGACGLSRFFHLLRVSLPFFADNFFFFSLHALVSTVCLPFPSIFFLPSGLPHLPPPFVPLCSSVAGFLISRAFPSLRRYYALSFKALSPQPFTFFAFHSCPPHLFGYSFCFACWFALRLLLGAGWVRLRCGLCGAICLFLAGMLRHFIISFSSFPFRLRLPSQSSSVRGYSYFLSEFCALLSPHRLPAQFRGSACPMLYPVLPRPR